MKQIKSYMFEAGDTLYYVDKQGEVYYLEITEDLLKPQSEMPVSFFDNYVFKPYAPVTVYDDFGRLWLWSAKGQWTGAGDVLQQTFLRLLIMITSKPDLMRPNISSKKDVVALLSLVECKIFTISVFSI